MGRKLDLMGRKVMDVLEKVDVLEVQDLPVRHDGAVKERLTFTGPADWSPDQAEHTRPRLTTHLEAGRGG